MLGKFPNIYFIGCNKLLTCPRPEKDTTKFEQLKEKKANNCQGDFCKYKIIESIKYDLWKKRQKPNVKAFFGMIMKPPSAGANKAQCFEVPFFHLRHIREQKDQVALILLKHKIFAPDDIDEHNPSEEFHKIQLLKALPEIIKGNTLQSMYEKIKVCPKCFTIYELIHKEMTELNKTGPENYFHSWAEIEEGIKDKLIKFYRSGSLYKETPEEILAFQKKVENSKESARSPEPIIINSSPKQIPRYMMSKGSSPKKTLNPMANSDRMSSPPTGNVSNTDRKLTNLNENNESAIKKPLAQTQKILQAEEIISSESEKEVFRQTARQVRDTKLHMGLPAAQVKSTDNLFSFQESEENAILSDPNLLMIHGLNLFDQKINDEPTEFDKQNIEDAKKLGQRVAGTATQIEDTNSLKIGLMKIIQKAMYFFSKGYKNKGQV